MPSKHVLVVEDQSDNRRIVRDLLESVGYQVSEAVTGPAGVEMAIELRPDLILMDAQLPGMDGYTAVREIKARPELSAVPVIMVTSYAMRGDDRKAFQAGCDAYVPKPFSPMKLLETIRGFLGEAS